MTNRRGFTLIELLIVLVIIGTLSAMMSITTTSANDNAKASAIIGNLITMKKAAIVDYLENGDKNWTDKDTLRKAIAEDINTTDDAIKNSSYSVLKVAGTAPATDTWYIVYAFSNTDSSAIKDNIAARAGTTGIYAATAADTVTDTIYTNVAANTHIAIKVR